MTAVAEPRVVAVSFGPRVVAEPWRDRVKMAVTRPLYAFQVDGAAWLAAELANGRGAILADDPGLGKTTQTIAAILAAEALPAIVVCPKSTKLHWARELWTWAARRLRIALLSGRSRSAMGADVLVLNYELLRLREAELVAFGARTIVFDEASALRHPRPSPGHRAAVGTRLGHRVGRAVLLTGTPLESRVGDYWRLLHIVDPASWPSYEDFRRRYCTAPDVLPPNVRRIVTSRERVEFLDELRTRVEPSMLRRRKLDVLPDLPRKFRRSRLVELDPADMARYELAKADVVAWLKAQGDLASARRAVRALAFVKFGWLRRLAALGKLARAVPEYIERWFAGERRPLVVFAHHREVLWGQDGRGGLAGVCAGLGLRVASITGSDSDARRQAAVDTFQAGQADVFVAPILSAGIGLNLQRASDALFCERDWRSTRLEQAEDRCWRIGSLRQVSITYLDAAGTIDEHIARVNEARQRVIARVVDDEDPEGSFVAGTLARALRA